VKKISLLKKYISDAKYYARSWEREDAYRYVFKIKNDIIEAGFFIHYESGNVTKYVFELSTSYGCPVRCQHCASGSINTYRKVTADEIVAMYQYLLTDNDIDPYKKQLVTYSGIGEGSLQTRAIEEACGKIININTSTVFNFSTVGCDLSFFEFCDNLDNKLVVNCIQVTYLHFSQEKLTKLIPSHFGKKINFEELALTISKTKSRVRLNFVMIEGFNDDKNHWEEFIFKLQPCKSNITVRVSRLNTTEYSKLNGLSSPTLDKLVQLSKLLENNNIKNHIFTPEEDSNNMNCGQLIWSYNKELEPVSIIDVT
jgi:23S rRNA (adenine2503-C2)-methyltransferase